MRNIDNNTHNSLNSYLYFSSGVHDLYQDYLIVMKFIVVLIYSSYLSLQNNSLENAKTFDEFTFFKCLVAMAREPNFTAQLMGRY